jgi:hypothetical protein
MSSFGSSGLALSSFSRFVHALGPILHRVGLFAPLYISIPNRICVTLSGMTRKLPDTCAYGHIIDGSYCAPGKKPRRYCKKCAVRRVEEMRERRKAANTKVSNK